VITMTVTLRQLSEQASIVVLDHLELEASIPIVNGPQAQGDLIVVPEHYARGVTVPTYAVWREVPASGIELLRGAAGGNTHSLVSDRGACEWTTTVADDTGLALGVLRASAPAYLIHAEHGATGIAPGRYLVRRQRQAGAVRDWSPGFRSIEFVAD
jgi:hypothetical protein